MATISLLIAALALTGQNPTRPQQQDGPPMTLATFIESMHWDPAKQGPLIAIGADRLYINDGEPPKLASFEQKLVKVGGLNAIVQSWTTGLKDDDIPNAYDALSDDDKIAFLIATLRPGELSALFNDGICARDLSGQQKAALLSLIPKPFTFHEGESNGPGSFSSHQDLTTLPDDQRDRVRLQIHKGVQLSYGSETDGRGTTRSFMAQSLSYRGPKGTPIVQSDRSPAFRTPKVPGQIVDNVEKKSDLSWGDPRLAKKIDLSASSTVGDALDAIRNLTGVEVYADVRVASRGLNCYGSSCMAGDLLRGIAWGLCGTFRQVGPAYVLTANREGKGSVEARLAAIDVQGQLSIRSNVNRWREAFRNANLYQNVPIAKDDTFQGASVASNLFAPPDSQLKDNWVQLSELPGPMQNAVAEDQAQQKENEKRQADFFASHPNVPRPPSETQTWSPVSSLSGMVKLSYEIGCRFVLPDGRPLEYRDLRPDGSVFRVNRRAPQLDPVPIDPKLIKPGGGIAVKSDDPAKVAAMCGQIKQHGIAEVWLESRSPAAIKAAVDSGLAVDLIIRPWTMMKGEACPDPDRNVIGQTGDKIAQIPGARYEPTDGKVTMLADTISPGDPDLPAHWARLATLASTKGIQRVILLDTQPDGYQPPVTNFHGPMMTTGRDGKQIEPGLPALAPALFQFGFTAAQRVEFLRKHRIDPIDLTPMYTENHSPLDPYFDQLRMARPLQTVYPGVHFPRMARERGANSDSSEWQKNLNDLFMKQFPSLGETLSKACPAVLMAPLYPDNPMRIEGPIHFVSPFAADGKLDWKEASANFLSLSPLNSEDEQGKIFFRLDFLPDMDKPFCFDLTDVPPDRIPAYLNFLFKK